MRKYGLAVLAVLVLLFAADPLLLRDPTSTEHGLTAAAPSVPAWSSLEQPMASARSAPPPWKAWPDNPKRPPRFSPP